MAASDAGCSTGGVNPCGPVSVIPIGLSDKLRLVEEPLNVSNGRERGRMTWIAAVLGLPLVGLCLLLGVFLLATSTSPLHHHPKPEKLLPHPSRKIFIVDVNHSSVQSTEKLKNLENCLKQHKFSQVYLILVNRYTNQPVNLEKYDNLKAKYPNFHYLLHNPTAFFSGSIFENSMKEAHSLRQLLFKAQLLTLWRYGGIVLSPFWTPLKSVNKTVFELGKGNLVVGSYNDRVGMLASRNTCNARVYEMMKEMCNMHQLGKSFESDVIDKVMVVSKKGVERLTFPTLCNNITRNAECILMKNDEVGMKVGNSTLVAALQQRLAQQRRAPLFMRRFIVIP